MLIRHQDWAVPLRDHPMAAGDPRVRLTSRHIEIDGVARVPVSGDMHYSRVPRRDWRERLGLLRAGGVTVVSTYAIWLHHEPERGRWCFTGNLDIAGFVTMAEQVGLDVVLRIGPWCHGEVRNGGFPDWVQAAPVAHRTDDPGYLGLVRSWFGALGAQVGQLCEPGGPVLAVQLENELYDQPAHLITLKRLARACGITAPLWTATAWGGAQLPPDEVMPVFGGYADGFWVDADAGWDDTFHAHFFFTRAWDDAGIGADVRESPGGAEGGAASGVVAAGLVASAVTASEVADARGAGLIPFPPVTCELGGGMATAYHRRPVVAARDIAAVAHTKMGNGSAWQGYYMAAGGVNPRGTGVTWQESQATGYPNDLPMFDYDFHAPVGAAGQVTDTHAELRLQHAFLEAFGERLTGWSSSLPETMPSGVGDRETMRCALRSDGVEGVVFLAWTQAHEQLADLADVAIRVALADETEVAFPSVTIPAGTLARWPVNLAVGNSRVRWATASVLTVLGDGTLVLLAEPGVEPLVAAERVRAAVPGRVLEADGVRVLVLDAADRLGVWVLEVAGEQRLFRSEVPLWVDEGRLWARVDGPVQVAVWNGADFVDLAHGPVGGVGAWPVDVELVREASRVPSGYGERAGRAAAPSVADVAAGAARWRLAGLDPGLSAGLDPGWAGARAGDRGGQGSRRRRLVVHFAGDVAQVLAPAAGSGPKAGGGSGAGGSGEAACLAGSVRSEIERGGVAAGEGWRVVADRFWDGQPWHLDLDALGIGDEAELRILPLAPDAEVWLAGSARARRRGADGELCSLDQVSLTVSHAVEVDLDPTG